MSKLYEVLENRGENYIMPFFWQHGEDDTALLREIDAIYESGVRALCVESRTHEQFCEDGWWHTMDVILSACRERGMKVWLLDDKHFPSGYANDIIRKKYPDQTMWGITERHVDVTGPQKDASVLYQWKTSPEDVLLGIVACKRVSGTEILTGETIDLTDALYDDMVYFDLPEGSYRIVFLFKTRSGMSDWSLRFADKLTEFGGDAFLEAVYEPHYAHYRAEFGKTFAGFFSDEPCFGNNTAMSFRAGLGKKYSHFPYTDEVLSLMKEKLGECVLSILPGLWFDTEDPTMRRVRLAYMDVITALYSKNFTYKLGNWCRERGVEYIGHIIEDDEQHTGTQNSAGHYFRALDGQDMAGIDVVMCQIVPGMTDEIQTVPCSYDTVYPELYHFALPKLGSSHAHIQPEKKGRAMCEIYGAYGWAEGLKMMKWLTDLMLVRGINRFVPHAFSPKFPDPDCPPHMYAGGENPQYPGFRMLMEYMNRICHFHDGGTHIASAALLYHAEARWANGDAPGAHQRVDVAARYLTEHQLDYDIISADYLVGARVENGQLCLAGERYPALIVPGAKTLPENTVSELLRLAGEGLRIRITETLPRISETGAEVPFAEAGITAVPTEELDRLLRDAGAADVTTDRPVRSLRFYHYEHGGIHTYFLTNEGIRAPIDCELLLSAFSGGKYIAYDAMENRASVKCSASGAIPLHLDPYESVMLIFEDGTDGLPEAGEEELQRSDPLEAEWKVFCATHGEYPVFKPYRITKTLFNVTGRDAMPRFSGHIRYETAMTLSRPLADVKVYLDLGAVGETASLLMNGQYVGCKIAPPYCFDITDYVIDGENTVTVEVTNHLGYQMRDHFSKFLLFEPSGLLGPVTLRITKAVD